MGDYSRQEAAERAGIRIAEYARPGEVAGAMNLRAAHRS